MDTEFLGQSMKFPIAVNKATGRFETSKGNQSVKEAIHIILMTGKTERFMRPEFGTNIMSYTFRDTNVSMLNLLARDLKNDIENEEPRITDVTVSFDTKSKQGVLFVNIDYTVIAENVRENMVFPFYLNADEEEAEEEAELDENELL